MEKLNTTGTALEVKNGMARAFFLSAYADACEEAPDTNPYKKALGPLGGRNWDDIAPKENDPAAIEAAEGLAADLQKDNRAEDLAHLYQKAREAKDYLEGDREMTPHNFGFYLAMQAMGHGVGLFDSFGEAVADAIEVADYEFHWIDLEKAYF